MNFRMFTYAASGLKVAVRTDAVEYIEEADKESRTTYISIGESRGIEVAEDFDTVLARLNTIAE